MKNGCDLNCEVGNIEAYIDEFKNKKIKELEKTIREWERRNEKWEMRNEKGEIKKLKLKIKKFIKQLLIIIKLN